jgi:hypothetical protein
MSRNAMCEMYLEMAQKTLRLSGEMNELFNGFIKLFERECEMMQKMEQNRQIKIQEDSIPF